MPTQAANTYVPTGRFECAKCPEYHTAVLRYCLLMFGIVAVNAILMWELGAASSAASSWNDPEAADYVDVGICYNTKHHASACMLLCCIVLGTCFHQHSLQKHCQARIIQCPDSSYCTANMLVLMISKL